MKIETHINHLPAHKIYLKMIAAIKSFLESKKYQEVDMPVLSPALIPESHIEVFETEYRYFSERQKLYLIPAQELFLKRLLAYGVGDCFTLGKTFRNHERKSELHSGEFTMLEYYRTHMSYMEMADELLELLRFASKQCFGKDQLTFRNKTIRFDTWEKLSVAEAFQKYAHIPSEHVFDRDLFIKSAKTKGYNVDDAGYEEVFSQIYGHEIEPNLGVHGMPTLLYDYPSEFAATARLNADGRTAARFDVYIEGIELGNCYTELTDPEQTRIRFAKQQERRKKLGKIDYPIDKGFIDALQYGLIDCSGATIGIDRLGMIFANVGSIGELKVIELQEN